ncbi:hypothetical protein COJ25_17155 [Bacillus cereus]|nr:hypothetical protein COJ25_17155 [Bacillus cereus]
MALLFRFRPRAFGESVVLSEGGAWWWCTFVVVYRIVHTLESEPCSYAVSRYTRVYVYAMPIQWANEGCLCRVY